MTTSQSKTSYRPAFAIDSLLNFITQLLIFAFSLVSSIIIARSLGPAGKGLYSFLILLPTLIATVINMGINSANVYFIGQKTFSVHKILTNAFFYSILVGSGFAIILVLSTVLYNIISLKNFPIFYVLMVSPMIILLLIIDNINYTFLAHRQIMIFSLIRFLRVFIYVFILIWFYFFSSLSVLQAIVANIIGLLFATLLGAFFLNKRIYLRKVGFDILIFKEIIGFGYKQHLGSIFQFLNYRVDMFIVLALLSQGDLGLYSISVIIAETVWYLPNSIGQILYAKISSEKNELANKFTPLVCRTIIILIMFCCVIIYALSDIIIPVLFSSSFSASVLPLKLLLPGVIFLSISKIIGSDLSGRGFPQYSTIASGVSLIVTVIFDLLFIPIYGINGAAVASSLSYMANAVVILHFFKRTSGIPLRDTLFLKFHDFLEYKRILVSLKPSL